MSKKDKFIVGAVGFIVSVLGLIALSATRKQDEQPNDDEFNKKYGHMRFFDMVNDPETHPYVQEMRRQEREGKNKG